MRFQEGHQQDPPRSWRPKKNNPPGLRPLPPPSLTLSVLPTQRLLSPFFSSHLLPTHSSSRDSREDSSTDSRHARHATKNLGAERDDCGCRSVLPSSGGRCMLQRVSIACIYFWGYFLFGKALDRALSRSDTMSCLVLSLYCIVVMDSSFAFRED